MRGRLFHGLDQRAQTAPARSSRCLAGATGYVFPIYAERGLGMPLTTAGWLSTFSALVTLAAAYAYIKRGARLPRKKPIMAAGACLMGAGASVRHIAIGQIDLRVVLGLAIGGIPAVLVAAFIVREMPVEILRWLVFVVVVYACAIMSRAAWIGRRAEKAGVAVSPVAVS
jgi:hypothetical protein